MNKYLRLFLFISMPTALFLTTHASISDTLSPREMVEESQKIMRGESNRMKMAMFVKTPRWERRYILDTYMKGNDKTLIHILEPTKNKGEGYLKLRLNLWSYFPTVERSVIIPPSSMLQPFLGSDFSYDDLVKASNIAYDYQQNLLGEEYVGNEPAYVIELIPKPDAAVVYGRLKLWLRKQDFVPLRQDFYDENAALLKRMDFSKIQKMGRHNIPTVWNMTNYIKDGRVTTITIISAEFDVQINDSMFTLRELAHPQ